MTYEQTGARSFRFKDESSGDIQEFEFREKFTLWQTKQIGLYYADLTDQCTKMGTTVISSALGIVNAVNSKSVAPLAAALNNLTAESLGDVAVKGTSELARFLCKDNNIERLAAILFLKKNEKSLKEEQLTARIALFENQLELSFVWSAAKYFFAKKLESLGISLSHLKTFAKQKIELAIQTSEESTVTSESGSDTSTLSPKDTPSESLTS
jgi:hypothetical protein